MVKVRITSGNFVLGINTVPKGTIIELAPPVARYVIKNGEGEYVDGDKPKAPPKKKSAKKKATYKTRDLKAE